MRDRYGNFIDEDKERVIRILHSQNKHLNDVTKIYFASRISKPELGKDTFKYVEHHFNYALREYSIVNSCLITPTEDPTQEELLLINNIPIEIFEKFKLKVTDILESYTDKEWLIDKKYLVLKKQLVRLADIMEDNYVLKQKLNNINPLDDRTTRFLNDITEELKKAGVNQVNNDNYIVIEKLIELYKGKKDFLTPYNFKEKKKYLKKLNRNEAKIKLHGYIKDIMEDEYIENPKDEEDIRYNNSLIQRVRWFLFYLIYDANKVDIFMIHSILGYKYDGAVKVYQKIFLKDHNTGRNDNFLHHTDILNISENSVYNREHEANYEKILNDIIEYKSLKKNQIKKDRTYQYYFKEKMSEYNSFYNQILQTMNKELF